MSVEVINKESHITAFVLANSIDAWMTKTYINTPGVFELNKFQDQWIANGQLDEAIIVKAGIVAGITGIALLSRFYEYREGRLMWHYISDRAIFYGNRIVYAALGWNSLNVIADHFQLVDQALKLASAIR